MTPSDLRTWRETAGLSQSGLAALLGIRQNTVSRWELGTRSIPPYLGLAIWAISVQRDGLILEDDGE